jgi:hypothetical protein
MEKVPAQQHHTPSALSRDDEAFTFNKRLNRLSTIKEYFMMVRALDRGVPEESKAYKSSHVDTRGPRSEIPGSHEQGCCQELLATIVRTETQAIE